jgi:hypothetical protein
VKRKLGVCPLYLVTALAAMMFFSGCRSVTTLQLSDRTDVPPEQLTTLVVPWCISLRTLDGAPAPSTLADELRLVLNPGPHTMEARYVVLFPTRGGDNEKIASDYVRVTFNGEAGKTYIVCSKDPKTLEEARRYAAHVSLWIEDKGAGQKKGVALPGFPSSAPAVTAGPTPVAKPVTAPSGVGNPDIQAQLQEIWSKAGEQDRKAFRDKLLQQQ